MLRDMTGGTGRTAQRGRSGPGLSPDGIWMAESPTLEASSLKEAGKGLKGLVGGGAEKRGPMCRGCLGSLSSPFLFF